MTSGDAASSGSRPDVLAVATLAKTHGIRGELRIKCNLEYVDFLRDVADEGHTVTLRLPESGDEYEVTFASVRGSDDSPIVKIDGIDNRTDAEPFRGAQVCLARELIPAPEEDEYFLADLEDCEVFDSLNGHLLGRVTKAEALPANTVLTIKLIGGAMLYAPLANDAVPTVDVEARRIEVNSDFLGIGADADDA